MEEKKRFDESIGEETSGAPETDEAVKASGHTEDDGTVEIEIEDGSKAAEEAKASKDKAEAKAGKKKDKSERKTDKKDKKRSADALELELKKAEEKAEDFADKYQRLLAEFENARNRSAKEQAKMFDIGAKSVLEKLLPVVDNFERGIEVLSDEEKEAPFAQGIIKIYQQLMTVLDQIGVKPIEAVGKEFNANFHNAVMHEENDEMGENLVSQEFQKGYMYKEDVLRHSMVKVVN